MYVFYLATIILAPLFVFFILLYVVPEKMYHFYENQLVYESDGCLCDFYNHEWQCEKLKGQPEVLEKLKKNHVKKERWYAIYLWDDEWKAGLMFIVGLLLFIAILVSIVAPLSASLEIARWEEFLPMAETTIANGSDMENVAITGNVIEYNTWLAEARASLKAFGCWSRYYTNRDLITTLPYLGQ